MPDENSLDDKFEDLLREVARIDDIPSPTVAMELIGRTLGRFRILSLLGKGGMGVVYLAEDETLRREVALKVLSRDSASDPERRRRLLQEARAAAAVGHPNIAAIYEVGESDGLLYIAMERVLGESLRTRIARGPIPIEEATAIARQILDGLAIAHHEGIVHRDMKPDNVMVDANNRVKLLDFGLAKYWRKSSETTESGANQTEEGRLLGTPSYMSPEQAAGLPLDARSDVFSFGVVFYEMATGEQPFQGTNFLKILAAIERDEPLPISHKNPNISLDIDRIVQRCLDKDATQRYADAREVLKDLNHIVTLVSAPPSLPISTNAPIPTPPPSSISLGGVANSQRPGKHTLPWAIVAVLGVLIVLSVISRRFETNAAHSTPEAAATTSSSVAIIPTALTDLPLAPALNTGALTAYKRSLAKYRLGDGWPDTDLRLALDQDPTFAPAYLRLAANWTIEQGMIGRKRENFQKAWEHSTNLSERDMALLEAFDPLFRTQPINPPEYLRRISVLTERWPGDADLWLLRALGNRRNDDIDAMLRDATHARELDPRFAVAYAVLGQGYAALGKTTEARREYEACVAAVPTSALCMQGLAVQVSMAEGQCKEVETLARKMLSISPDWFEAYLLLGDALAGHADSLLAVQETTLQWEKAVDARADATYKQATFLPARRLENQAHIDALVGNFASAEKNARESVQIRAPSAMLADHTVPMLELAYIYAESGQPEQAGKLAHDYLLRSRVWEPPGKGVDFARPQMLEFTRLGNLLSSEAFIEQRDEWVRDALKIARSKATGRNYIWYAAYANLVHDAASAREALQKLPDYEPVGWSGAWTSDLAVVGHMHLLCGNVDEAIQWLEQATHHCRTFSDPIFHVRSYLWLGQARELKGDKSGACAAYKAVLDRWGHAKPKSVTADEARARARLLGCTM